MSTKETVVISVGGSLIAPPSGIDTGFLKKLKALIETHIKKGYRFVIISGGGSTARSYQDAARKIGKISQEDTDWLGIHACRINGHLLLSLLRDKAYPRLVKNPEQPISTAKPLIIATGWKPGRSSDFVAVRFAKAIGAKKFVNLSNIDYVYDKDPKKHKDAKPIKDISWTEFRKLIPAKWSPGVHAPVDPVAAKLAHAAHIEAVMLNGEDLEQLSKYLAGKSFKGTRIS